MPHEGDVLTQGEVIETLGAPEAAPTCSVV